MSQADASTPMPTLLPQLARRELSDSGGEGDALLSAVGSALVTLERLSDGRLLEASASKNVEETLRSAKQRLARKELHVVVVGERRSGKSTLLDAIVGDRLLGGARGRIGVPTFIRRREAPSYVATFLGGATEDFAVLVPDSTPEFARAGAELEESIGAAKSRCSAGRSGLRRAIEARESAEHALVEAESTLAALSRTAGIAETELSAVEHDARRIDGVVAEVEPSIPPRLRPASAGWAIWLWLLRILFVLFKRSVWTRYRALLLERETIRSRLLAGRSEARERSEGKTSAAARLVSLRSDVTTAREHESAVERALRDAEKERDALLTKLDDLRSEREHYESERRRRFFSDLNGLSGERGRERRLVELSIDYPARLLPEDVTIIDMPGESADGTPHWGAMRERVDGCIFVSELDRAVSESAKRFLRQVREVMPHLLLVLTKVDNAFAAAMTRGGNDPWGQVEQARRIGTRRFARELGREPESVLSIAVAAEVALKPRESELGRRFETEIAKLFQLLRHERAIIVGAHAGSAIRRCIGGTAAAQQLAEHAYRDKIAELERKRTPLPEAFSKERLAAAEDRIEGAARDAVRRAAASLRSGFAILGRLVEQTVGDVGRRNLVAAVERLSSELPHKANAARREAHLELESGVEDGVESISSQLFEELRERYQLLHTVERSSNSSPRLGAPSDHVPKFDALVPAVRSAVVSFDKSRYALGAAGAGIGASAGAVVHSWVFTLAGTGLGALLLFARSERALVDRVRAVVTQALDQQEKSYADELEAAEPDVKVAIHAAIQRSLERAILRFGRWIAEPIEAEQMAIDGERQKLAELERLRGELAHHDRELERLLEAAAAASVGLCR